MTDRERVYGVWLLPADEPVVVERPSRRPPQAGCDVRGWPRGCR
jgi:hypothetical protein